MRIAVIKEQDATETRSPLSPESVKAFLKLGASVAFEPGVGAGCAWPDNMFTGAGAELVQNRGALLAEADALLCVRRPSDDDLGRLRQGVTVVGFLDPFRDFGFVRRAADAGLNTLSVELIPRTTRAQRMDALSSQHSIAGYYMAVLAAERLGKALPMMTTPSGSIHPARVLVIGAGVAGLQAIATAKRLGARVEAFDTRPIVKEQVESLGAKFVEVDLGETGQTEGGYAKELTPEQRERQQAGLTDACARVDVVITTAQLFGRPAPIVVSSAMLARMKPGSLVIDYAVESGGNVEGSKVGETEIGGVRVIGLRNYPGRVAVDASRMYANNLTALVGALWDAEAKTMMLDQDDEIVDACLVTTGGEVVHPMIRDRMAASAAENGGQA